VSGNNDTVSGEIKAPISFVVSRVTKEGAQGRARSKFVWGSGCEIGIASAAKHSKLMVGGMEVVEGEERGGHMQCFGGETVDEIGGSG